MDPEEYRALCTLRDGAYEDLRLQHLALRNRYDGLLEVNREQVDRLSRLTLANDHLRAGIARAEANERKLATQIRSMETLRTVEPQPLHAYAEATR